MQKVVKRQNIARCASTFAQTSIMSKQQAPKQNKTNFSAKPAATTTTKPSNNKASYSAQDAQDYHNLLIQSCTDLLKPIPQNVTIVDTHIHLEFLLQQWRYEQNHNGRSRKQFLQDEMFGANGKHLIPRLNACLSIFCDPPSFSSLGCYSEFLKETDMPTWKMYFSFGLHPHNAKYYDDKMQERILNCIKQCGDRVVAYGECGLDYHYNNSEQDIQRDCFSKQLKIAVQLQKPIVIHTREAEQDTILLLKDNVPATHKMHIHCFTDTFDFAKQVLSHFSNAYFGFTGVITYKSAQNVRDVAKQIPLNRILLETDGPYMPASLSSKRVKVHAHALHVVHVAQTIAQAKNLPLQQVLEQCRQNTKDVYGI